MDTQFIGCNFVAGAVLDLGDQIPLGSVDQRQSKRNDFHVQLAEKTRPLAGGPLLQWASSYDKVEGELAVAILPSSSALTPTDFNAISNLPGAIVMSLQRVYDEGLEYPWRGLPTRNIANVENLGVVTPQQVDWTMDEFASIEAPNLFPNSIWLTVHHYVQPKIFIAIRGANPLGTLVIDHLHAHQAYPRFDLVVGGDACVSSMSDIHEVSDALLSPEFISSAHYGVPSEAREGPDVPDMPDYSTEKKAGLPTIKANVARLAEMRAAGIVGNQAHPRQVVRRPQVGRKPFTEVTSNKAGEDEEGWIDFLRRNAKKTYGGKGDGGWFDTTMGRMGGALNGLLDAFEYATAFGTKAAEDPKVQQLVKYAAAAV